MSRGAAEKARHQARLFTHPLCSAPPGVTSHPTDMPSNTLYTAHNTVLELAPVGGVASLVSGDRRTNEVNPRRARLVPGRVTHPSAGGYTISVCDQPTRSTQPGIRSGVAKSSTSFGWGKGGGNITSAGWQVTPRGDDPAFHRATADAHDCRITPPSFTRRAAMNLSAASAASRSRSAAGMQN